MNPLIASNIVITTNVTPMQNSTVAAMPSPQPVVSMVDLPYAPGFCLISFRALLPMISVTMPSGWKIIRLMMPRIRTVVDCGWSGAYGETVFPY